MTTITRIDEGARMSEALIHNGIVYLSGQVGEIGDSVADQTRTALAEIDMLLARAGSSKAHILSAQIWLADMAGFEQMNGVWDAWIADVPRPTRATGESKLADPGYLVEVIVTAALA